MSSIYILTAMIMSSIYISSKTSLFIYKFSFRFCVWLVGCLKILKKVNFWLIIDWNLLLGTKTDLCFNIGNMQYSKLKAPRAIFLGIILSLCCWLICFKLFIFVHFEIITRRKFLGFFCLLPKYLQTKTISKKFLPARESCGLP